MPALSGSAQASIFPVMSSKTLVHVLDESDSLTPIVTAARKPSVQNPRSAEKTGMGNMVGDHHPFFDSQVHVDTLRDQIANLYGEPGILEPEIVLVVGEVFSLAGCPPWHLKSSEIYYLGCLESLVLERLTTLWERYCGTVQRYGK